MKIIPRPVTATLAIAASIPYSSLHAGTTASVNLNIRHEVGGISEFDREKYITVHSSLTEGDWVGEEAKLDYLINDLDVHFGRDNGIMILYLDQVAEDPNRPGYADPADMTAIGQSYREDFYGTQYAKRHSMDAKNDVMIGGQTRAFWTGEDNPHGRLKPGWQLAGVEASGEFMGHFLNEFYRDEGQGPQQGAPRPKYLEILNEPLYELIDGHKGSTVTPLEVFEFHNEMAAAIRTVNDTTLLGGYTTAFPIFEERDFARWDERMKLFIDTSGAYMDYFSLHFYDFNDRHYKGRDYYKGGRVEATMDMIEQYSLLRLGEVKPFLISEYGGRDHLREKGNWSPRRDWEFMKAFSPLMLSFMDRPDVILKSIPFIVAKAEWGTSNGIPYNWRLLRKASEGSDGGLDEWVFTEQIKFYELWSDVTGTRVETKSSNLDVMMDAYVDGHKAYVILSNLNDAPEQVRLKLFDGRKTGLKSVKVKQLHLKGEAPQLLVYEQKKPLHKLTLANEATAIIEYTFNQKILIPQTLTETKYYSTTYNQPIEAGAAIEFKLEEVAKNRGRDAVLRIGLGRDKDRSRQPVVKFNGVPLEVPSNYRGTEQKIRSAFFWTLGDSGATRASQRRQYGVDHLPRFRWSRE